MVHLYPMIIPRWDDCFLWEPHSIPLRPCCVHVSTRLYLISVASRYLHFHQWNILLVELLAEVLSGLQRICPRNLAFWEVGIRWDRPRGIPLLHLRQTRKHQSKVGGSAENPSSGAHMHMNRSLSGSIADLVAGSRIRAFLLKCPIEIISMLRTRQETLGLQSISIFGTIYYNVQMIFYSHQMTLGWCRNPYPPYQGPPWWMGWSSQTFPRNSSFR